jgi:hypothetical protein
MSFMFYKASNFNGDLSSWDGEFYTFAAGRFVFAALAAAPVSYRPA